MARDFYVYILASHRRAMYIGVTNDIQRRLLEHRTGVASGFTKKYKITSLVHLEATDNPYSAICREKELKGWRREKKVRLIEETNPTWRDLSVDF
jgi:putative endonuclease